jgi:hypothetical protein
MEMKPEVDSCGKAEIMVDGPSNERQETTDVMDMKLQQDKH